MLKWLNGSMVKKLWDGKSEAETVASHIRRSLHQPIAAKAKQVCTMHAITQGSKAFNPQKGKPSTASKVTSLTHSTSGDVFSYKLTLHLLQKTSPGQLWFSNLWSFMWSTCLHTSHSFSHPPHTFHLLPLPNLSTSQRRNLQQITTTN